MFRRSEADPLLVHARKECAWILSVWTACFIYTCTYCYLFGYVSHEPSLESLGPPVGAWVGSLEKFDRQPETLVTYLGVPDWIVFGVLLPWLVCLLFTIWFCTFYFTDDPLGEVGNIDS